MHLPRFDVRMEEFNFPRFKIPVLKLSALNVAVLIVSVALASILTPSKAYSDTFARVFPIASQAMITIYRARNGGSDADAKALFDLMDMPAQGSVMGPGKGFKDSNQILTWACADRGANGYQCSITIRKDAKTIVRDNPPRLRYEATGAEAAALQKMFKPNQPDGTFKYVNQEVTFEVEATPAHFLVIYHD